jgi:hypothetical protein
MAHEATLKAAEVALNRECPLWVIISGREAL